MAEHWDGTSWTLDTLPPLGSASELVAVACATATSCQAVGRRGGGATMALTTGGNGTWSAESAPDPRGTSASSDLTSVSCASATDCEAVGQYAYLDPAAEHWDGSRRTRQKLVSTYDAASTLAAISCPPATFCLATGHIFKHSSNGAELPLAQTWNGTAWQKLTVPLPAGDQEFTLDTVSCSSATACLVIGISEPVASQLPAALQWNGTTWTELPALPQTTEPTAVSCVSTSFCVAVTGSWAESWNGTAWTAVEVPLPPGGSDATLAGVSCTATNACVAVGTRAKVQGRHVHFLPLAEVWNGTAWSPQALPAPSQGTSTLLSVSCTSASACTATGGASSAPASQPMRTALQWNGTTWRWQHTWTPRTSDRWLDDLTSVSCTAPATCVAVGTYTPAAAADNFTLPWTETEGFKRPQADR